MEIRCEQCGRAYNYPDEKITEAGIVLRCTACGHTFRARRRAIVETEPVAEVEAEASPSASPKNWLIRQKAGNVITFQDFATLRRWVLDGRVARDDEISRAGEVWRKLGSVPEFQGLFAPLPQTLGHGPERPKTASFSRPGGLTARPATAGDDERSMVSMVAPPASDASEGYSLGDMMSASSPAWAKQATTQPEASDLRAPTLPERPAAKAAPAARPPKESPKPDPSAFSWADAPPVKQMRLSDVELADDEPISFKPKRRRWGMVALAVLLLLGLTAGALYIFQRPLLMRLFGIEPAATAGDAAALARAMEAVARDDFAGAESQLRELLRGKREPRALAALSRVHATWADYLADVGEATAAKPRAGEALREAEEARGLSPALREAQLAYADGLRLAGRRAEAEKLVQELGTVAEDAGLAFVRGALAAAEPSRFVVAEASLEQALAKDASLLRARVRLARIAKEKHDPATARRHLEAVLRVVPSHEFAKRLLEWLPREASAPPKPVPAALTTSMPAPAPPLPKVVDKKETDKKETDKKDTDKKEADKKEPPKKLTAKQLVAKANRMRDMNPQKAIVVYDEALQMGESSAAHKGKGWAYLEMGESTLAVREFKKALSLGAGSDTYIGLGTAYRKLNQREQAREQFQKYLLLHPDGDEAPVAKTNLDSLK